MRRVVASSLSLGVFVLLACSSDYGSDDPANPGNGEGGASSSGDGGGSSSGEGGGNKEGGFEPGKPITITGKIVSYSVPLPNIPVVVGGKTAVTTSALGTFTVADVIPPYNVSFAVKTNDGAARVTVYQGLTRSDPTLVALGTNGELRPNPTTATSMSGKVDGAGGPPYTKFPVIGLGGPSRAYGFKTVDANGLWTMTATEAPVWYGPPSITGTLYAALVLDTTAPATAFFGKLENVALTGAATITDKNVTLQSIPVGTLEAAVAAPASYSDPAKTVVNMGIRYQDAAGYFIRIANPGAFPVDVKRAVPLVDGGDYQLSVCYTAGGDGEISCAKKTAPGASVAKVSVELPTPPQPDSPADNATIGLGDTFRFGTFSGGVHRFTLVAANQTTVTVVSADNFITLPDLAPFAVSIPTGVEYTWRGAGYRPVDSVDSDELPAILAALDSNLPNVDECEIGIGVARRVTFKP